MFTNSASKRHFFSFKLLKFDWPNQDLKVKRVKHLERKEIHFVGAERLECVPKLRLAEDREYSHYYHNISVILLL